MSNVNMSLPTHQFIHTSMHVFNTRYAWNQASTMLAWWPRWMAWTWFLLQQWQHMSSLSVTQCNVLMSLCCGLACCGVVGLLVKMSLQFASSFNLQLQFAGECGSLTGFNNNIHTSCVCCKPHAHGQTLNLHCCQIWTPLCKWNVWHQIWNHQLWVLCLRLMSCRVTVWWLGCHTVFV